MMWASNSKLFRSGNRNVQRQEKEGVSSIGAGAVIAETHGH